MDELSDEVERFREVLNDCMLFFLSDLELVALAGLLLTVQEKIDWLTQLVDYVDGSETRKRLLENLRYCGWVESERRRLMREARRALSIAWIAPFCKLSDEMGSAGAQLDETFQGYMAHL